MKITYWASSNCLSVNLLKSSKSDRSCPEDVTSLSLGKNDISHTVGPC